MTQNVERRGPGRPIGVDPDAIAVVALRLFEERGVDAVTMTEVAEAAGVSRRTLFRWFPSKAALVWGGTVEADERFERGFPREGDLFTRVRAAYLISIRPLGRTADVTRLRLRLIAENPSVYAWGAPLRAEMADHLGSHVAETLGIDRESLRVQTIVAAISAASYSALAWWARYGGDRPPEEVLDEALAALAGAFIDRAPPPPGA